MDMAAGELDYPPVANLDLAISGRGTVANDKMVGETIRHAPDMAVIVVKDPGVSLASPTIVNHNVFPPIPGHSCIIDGPTHSGSQVSPAAIVVTGRDGLILAA